MRTKLIIGVLLAIVIIGAIIFFGGMSLRREKPAAQESWPSTINGNSRAAFNYPEDLSSAYIEAVDWPPRVEVLDAAFTCAPAGEETERAGGTEEVMIGDTTYCVTKVTEGAAGSVYTQYAYAFAKDGKTVIFTFSTRMTNCGAYDEAQKGACENEQKYFDMNGIVYHMSQSLKLQ